jgi:DNA repair exonuclease SbcCD ATPase subunit
MKEDALRKSEMMLEEDAMRFDAFLKENDRKAHEALKRADTETKEKQEKVIEIKRLNQEINKVDNEMSKYEEQLNACLKYKRFLDNLTPPEHKAAVSERKKSSKMRKLQDLKRYKPDVEMDIDDISSEEDPEEMYFKEPNQLLNIFAEIEERNLFLIQNVQETEEALEELKQKMNETEEKMREKTEQLDKNIQSLNEKIKIEEDKAQHYAKRNSANTTAPQTALLEKLRNKVQEVYEKCTGAGGEQSRPLDMLREIEAKLENLLLQIKALAEIDEERVKLVNAVS